MDKFDELDKKLREELNENLEAKAKECINNYHHIAYMLIIFIILVYVAWAVFFLPDIPKAVFEIFRKS